MTAVRRGPAGPLPTIIGVSSRSDVVPRAGDPGPPAEPRVVVAALTYRRPDDLAALLPAISSQARSTGGPVEVLIVDNDPQAGARRQVEDFGGGVRYLHAAAPGIAAARNAALDAAVDADLLVFIDDDERPVEGWLTLLVATWRRTRAAAVIGPVVSTFDEQPSPWVQAGRFFSRRRMPTGTQVQVAATNNLLLDLRVVRGYALRFDERFGLTGGSDTLFTRQLYAAGGRMVWCDEAIVTDVVPASRVSREWVMHRAYRSGNSDALTAVAMASDAGRAAVRLRFLARGAARVVAGAVPGLIGHLTGSLPLAARGSRRRARGAGMLAGALGRAYVEYRRSPSAADEVAR